MALRRPVISTYVGGIPELIEPGKHGWLIPAGDAEALAEAMQSCLESSFEQIALLGEAARQTVLDRHNVDEETMKLVGLFNCAETDMCAVG
jgi:colanic acid/amylovoran biosynthesis glycosyltransferase